MPANSRLSGFLRCALSRPVVRRASIYAVVVGLILVLINQGDAIFRGEVTSGHLWRMGLTVVVPYVVSTLSSVGAMREGSPPMVRTEERA